ncbi:sodium/hydrogen exchanger 9B1-like isoform X1 [Trichoplusia ni]|uniref:Sodium/hydrogen exchanger 9B1-like isoform X1 n=1 Tax=Trichoplusia ni TaxID=7111 RepID=A0A7E5WCG3_TRINI|nr:sodium/hydrogen exchanger 9B1-like isoform X1 [Trichoplusia ni]
MTENKNTTKALDKGVYIVHSDDLKTTPEITFNYNSDKKTIEDDVKKENKFCGAATDTLGHYLILVILGLASWGLLWCAFGEEWSWNGRWFKPAVVAAIAFAAGEFLQMTTSLPPLLAAILTGITARNVGYLDMREYTELDSFMRKIYPVIILGKGSLGWNLSYMKKNWQQVAALGVLPWTAEVATMAVCMNLLLGYPWLWGCLLGSIYASVSCPVLMPTVVKLTAGKNLARNWPQLICTAGGTDTALSVGVFGVLHSFIMYDGDDAYRYIRAACALLLGVVVGVSWGSVAKFLPRCRDPYVTELRVLFVVVGGLFANFLTSQYGWGGTGGIAVLACNATAAKHWAKDGWRLNNNPASTAYRVMWSAVEPALFAYTGTFFVMRSSISKVMFLGFGILVICLAVRLTVSFLVCSNLQLRERLFVCCAWVPKSIVEAVLCPVAINALLSRGQYDAQTMEYAEHLMRMTVQAILVTTPIGYLLTSQLGPILLKENSKVVKESEA